jgi:hypothetical protein
MRQCSPESLAAVGTRIFGCSDAALSHRYPPAVESIVNNHRRGRGCVEHVQSCGDIDSRDLEVAAEHLGAGLLQCRHDVVHAYSRARKLGLLPQQRDGPAGWPFCPPGLRPADLRCERGGGFLNGESEEGGWLELWLSLFRRASSSATHRRNCSFVAASSATSARSH